MIPLQGFFFQFIISIAILQTGVIIHWVRGFPQFYAAPLLGGFLNGTGNVLAVPAVRCVGMGLAGLFTSLFAVLVGWSYARFGNFSTYR